MRYEALNAYTDKLPKLEPTRPEALIGDSTASSINSGIIYGLVNEIEGAISHYKEEFPDLTIILTGGEDINPLEYNDTLNLAVCGDINYERDTLERRLFDFALEHKIPLIGVCRGMQMINVASGGSLYGDIPSEIGLKVIHRNNGEVNHKIVLTDTSSLIFPNGTDTIMVNSWHHQGLKVIPNHLRVVARAFDGLPEAVVMDTSQHPFMIAVQFHPERLAKENPIHQTMKRSFYKQIRK